MPEFIVHDVVEHGNFKQWIVFTNDDVLKNYQTNFGDRGIKGLHKAIMFYQTDFYEIKRYYQFVGLLKYTHATRMLTLSLFECSNMDEFLDGFLALQGKNWKTVDLTVIGKITQQIFDDTNKELATIRLNKLL